MFIIEEFADGGDLLGLLFKYGGKIPEVSRVVCKLTHVNRAKHMSLV